MSEGVRVYLHVLAASETGGSRMSKDKEASATDQIIAACRRRKIHFVTYGNTEAAKLAIKHLFKRESQTRQSRVRPQSISTTPLLMSWPRRERAVFLHMFAPMQLCLATISDMLPSQIEDDPFCHSGNERSMQNSERN